MIKMQKLHQKVAQINLKKRPGIRPSNGNKITE